MENNEIVKVGVQATQLGSGLDSSNRVKKFTTLDVNNQDDQNLLLNSMQKTDYFLKDFKEKEIEVTACYIVEREQETFNEETGDIGTRQKHVLVLYDVNNKSYLCASGSFYRSFMDICSIKGLPSKDNHLIIKPVDGNKSTNGHSFLVCNIVTK